MKLRLALLALGLCSSSVCARDVIRDDKGKGNDDAPATTSSTTNSTGSAATSGSVTGGRVCPTGVLGQSGLMCISGVINGTTTRYTLESLHPTFGWMALGFGQTMAGSPMVMMWPNGDGSVTLSQRQASGETPPVVVANPPRVATFDKANSNATSLSFTIDTQGGTNVNIIWAFGDSNIASADASTTLTYSNQHVDSGPAQLDLSAPVGDNGQIASGGSGTVDVPLLPFQKMIVAHAVLAGIGYLILLPAGAILARYARTFTNMWFLGHELFQLFFAGPVIIAGVALGFAATRAGNGSEILPASHKNTGIALLALYVLQCALGWIIHTWKPKSFAVGKKRPAQNYAHAVLGLVIIGLAFWQVNTGYRLAWPATSGRPPLSNSINMAWLAWVVIIPVLYFAGLAFLPRQLRQERPAPKEQGYADEPRYSDS